MTSEWVEQEMDGLSLGDKRLDKRTKRVLSDITRNPDRPFTQQFETSKELKACYRLLDSDLATPEAILTPHRHNIIERARAHQVVVVASDSSSVNYTSRSLHPDTGYISSNNAQGFFIHTSLACTLDHLPLGVLGSKFWAREKEKPKTKVHRDYLPIEEKESFKWIESYRQAQEFADSLPGTQVINVADKEADILELWQEALKNASSVNPAHLVVRCNHDRCVAPTTTNAHSKLREFVMATPVLGTSQFELRDRRTNAIKRVVTQDIRAARVKIRPAKRSGVEPTEIVLNVVLLMESSPPEGEEPVVWHLLTTLPVKTMDDIQKVIKAYLARWNIEVLFRTFKSGCKVEGRSPRTGKRMYVMFTLFLIVAWRINMLVHLARVRPTLPCSAFFSEVEWRSAVAATTKSLAHSASPPTIQEMLLMVAQLGGYLNRRNDPPPGATVVWRGLEYLRGFAEAYRLFTSFEEAQS